MSTLFSNGPRKDFVMGEYSRRLARTNEIFAAAPYVTLTSELVEAAKRGCLVRLLVGLNVSTRPQAIRNAFGIPNLTIRYFTDRFHAKLYLFDECALIGSSNLTDGGMTSNREATALVSSEEHLNEIRTLSEELWLSAAVLTEDVLRNFERAVPNFGQQFDPNRRVEEAVGSVKPQTIVVGSEKKDKEYLFLQSLYRRIFEKFKPAFDSVSAFIAQDGMHRLEWNTGDDGSETNRFLNWVRLVHAPGDDWQIPNALPEVERNSRLQSLGREWSETASPRISETYFDELKKVREVFLSRDSLAKATKEDLGAALMAIHAFYEQIRFVKGGRAALMDFFWSQNDGDEQRVKKSFAHLIFGDGDFTKRLYDLLYFPEWKLSHFGESCALELAGTVRPGLCPPMNGRSARALRFIGFDVPAN